MFKKKFIGLESIPNGWNELLLEDIATLSAGGDKPKDIKRDKQMNSIVI